MLLTGFFSPRPKTCPGQDKLILVLLKLSVQHSGYNPDCQAVSKVVAKIYSPQARASKYFKNHEPRQQLHFWSTAMIVTLTQFHLIDNHSSGTDLVFTEVRDGGQEVGNRANMHLPCRPSQSVLLSRRLVLPMSRLNPVCRLTVECLSDKLSGCVTAHTHAASRLLHLLSTHGVSAWVDGGYRRTRCDYPPPHSSTATTPSGE